jgi:hypothetical protein
MPAYHSTATALAWQNVKSMSAYKADRAQHASDADMVLNQRTSADRALFWAQREL